MATAVTAIVRRLSHRCEYSC